MSLIGVYGASGFGREVMPLVRHQFASQGAEVVFIDDGGAIDFANGHPVLTYEDFVSRPEKDKRAAIAIADSKVRQRIEDQFSTDSVSTITVCANNVLIGDNCDIGTGAILCGFVHLTADLTIGRSFHANIYSYVAHDCVVGDFVTFAPGVKCNGNIHIGDHAYIGTGAILKQGRPGAPLMIGEGAVIGMGAVVTKDVPPHTVVVGNPAKPFA